MPFSNRDDFAKTSGPSGCAPHPAFAGGSESAIIIIEKTRLLESGFWRSCGYRQVFVLGLHGQRSENFCASACGRLWHLTTFHRIAQNLVVVGAKRTYGEHRSNADLEVM